MTFARTKIQPPRLRPGALVQRRGLEARLGTALIETRLVLVCAAAGYGKTAALAREFERLPEGTARAWIAVDEGDDLHRLLACLVAALEPWDPPWRIAPEALISQATASDARQRQTAAAELLNTLEACEAPHGVIAFDDLHRTDDEAVFELLNLLLERLGPRWTVAIASRSEPPLALARLRARGEVAAFGQADLEFDRDEVRSLAVTTGLDAETADALYQRTHGWAVGLRLALSAPRDAGGALRRATVDRHVFEFLATEVLDELPDGLREFLLRTSGLPELNAARCAALTGLPLASAAALLDEIDRRGLFVSTLVADDCDPQATLTLKLHDLFREALEHRLHRERPQEAAALLERAAAGESDPVRRIGLLLRAGRLEEAAQVLLAAGPQALAEGAITSMARLVAQFPAEWAIGSPELQRMRGLVAWARWDFAEMLDAMRQAESAYDARGDLAGQQSAQAYQALALNAFGRMHEAAQRLSVLRREALAPEVRIIVLVACSWHALEVGAHHRVGPVLAELMDLLEGDPRMAAWYQCTPLPRFNGLPGTAGPLQRYVHGALRVAGDAPTPLRASAMVQQSWRLLWQGRLDAAEATWQRGVADAAWIGNPVSARQPLQAFSAVLHALRGDRAHALSIARARLEDRPPRGAWGHWQILGQVARIAALCDELALLSSCLRRMGDIAAIEHAAVPAVSLPLTLPLLGHAARLEGRRSEAIAHWRAALEHEEAMDIVGQAAETRLHLAHALLDSGDRAGAAAVLLPVFERVAAEGEPGGALFAPVALAALAAADWGGALAPDRQRLLRDWLAAVRPAARAVPPPTHAAPAQIVVPATALTSRPMPLAAAGGGDRFALSPREREVLERIAAGDSNKLIARAFDLSPHTVKRHVANLLDKLGVASRGQAAAWYRAQQGPG